MSHLSLRCPICESVKTVFITTENKDGIPEWFGQCIECNFRSSPSASIEEARKFWKKKVYR